MNSVGDFKLFDNLILKIYSTLVGSIFGIYFLNGFIIIVEKCHLYCFDRAKLPPEALPSFVNAGILSIFSLFMFSFDELVLVLLLFLA